jgi:glycosyltransferase involved in cell wall biosynthesis
MNTRLSVFIPAYNEEGNIEGTVHELGAALQARNLDYEIIIVNDGSRDRTGDILEALAKADGRIRVIHNPRNLGFAKTFRIGAQAARYEYVGWIPGDNTFPSASLEDWLAPIGRSDVIQTYLLNTEVRYIGRRLISRAYTKTMNALFGLNIKYYNGIQIYRRELIQNVQTSSDGFALQSETLVKLLAAGNTFIEIGLKMQERVQGQSKAVTIQNILDVIRTVIRLFVEIKLLHRSRYRWRGVKLSWQPPPAVAAVSASASGEDETRYPGVV